jgi:hypothetical protein
MAIHAKGLAVILTAAMAWHVLGLHFGVASWVPKTEKAAGRPVQDFYAKEKADERYGGIVHPVIGELAIMVDDPIEAAILSNPSLTMKDFTLLKMDLDAAYMLIDVHPAHASKFAVELIGGLVFIFLCGVFGWGSTHACFQVITRALAFESCKMFRGGSWPPQNTLHR